MTKKDSDEVKATDVDSESLPIPVNRKTKVIKPLNDKIEIDPKPQVPAPPVIDTNDELDAIDKLAAQATNKSDSMPEDNVVVQIDPSVSDTKTESEQPPDTGGVETEAITSSASEKVIAPEKSEWKPPEPSKEFLKDEAEQELKVEPAETTPEVAPVESNDSRTHPSPDSLTDEAKQALENPLGSKADAEPEFPPIPEEYNIRDLLIGKKKKSLPLVIFWAILMSAILGGIGFYIYQNHII